MRMGKSYYSTVIDRPADEVWAVVRDFNGLATWFSPPVVSSVIEDGKAGDQVGGMRRFVFGEATIREHLVSHSDLERSYTYRFGEPKPFPVDNYVATLRVTPVTETGASFVEWWTVFDPEPRQALDHWEAFFAAEVFRPALDSLAAYLRR
jgi:hypothetical protein